jgi:twitching motility protein PilU
MDLSANLRAIVSQRLVRREDGQGRSAAIEILLNTPTLAEKIFNGEFHEIKTIMSRSRELGMCTFDAALFDLYDAGLIGFDEALRNADSTNELRLNIKLKSKRGEPQASDFGGLALNPLTQPAELDEGDFQGRRRRWTSGASARSADGGHAREEAASPKAAAKTA